MPYRLAKRFRDLSIVAAIAALTVALPQPEAKAQDKTFLTIAATGQSQVLNELFDDLEPGANDSLVEKNRPDAFLNTCLECVLHSRGIETLVILGVNTEGCVESTVRTASYLDYYTVVVEDALGSPNRDRHDASLGLYRARYPLHKAEEILSLWRREVGSAAV